MTKKFPLYRQHDSNDCGPVCLQMITKYYGKSISAQSLRERTQIGKDGVNMLGIAEAAEAIGFRTRALKVSKATLIAEALLPCILYWNQNHFVVLYRIKRNVFYIADPASGLTKFDSRAFSEHWISDINKDGEQEGISLFLEASPSFYEYETESSDTGVQKKPGGLSFKNIFHYITPYKKLVLQLILGFSVSSILQLIIPFLTQSIVDVGINTENLSFLYLILIAQFTLFTGRLVADFIRSWIVLHISTRVNISILTEFLIKLMKLPIAFFDSKKTGDILQRMNDHQRIETFLTGSSVNILFSMANLLVFSIVLAGFNSTIYMIFLLASVLYSVWVILFLSRRKSLDYEKFRISSREQSSTIQMIQGMHEIKLNGIENSTRWNWESLQAKLFRINMKYLSLSQWEQSGAFFINEGKNILITFLAAKAVIDGNMTLGTMLAVQYIMGQLNSPIEQMLNFTQSWQNAKISMDRLNEIHTMDDEEPDHISLLKELPLSFTKILTGGYNSSDRLEELTISDSILGNVNPDIPVTIQNLTASKVENEIDQSIKFSNVSFVYPGAGNEAVLKDISLNIPKGKTTAIVGVSGSGKTTLLKLLLRFYEPQSGTIKIDSIPLNNISHRTWRRNCGAVMQDSFLFSDTIARNIAVGNDPIDMDNLHHAVSVANVQEFIESLPLGYNTKIGPEGIGISMGQRQRILIARSIYRNPAFIFLDEATNSLDTNNESTILRNLESFLSGRTVVVVAHRLSTVKYAHQIVVLNKGRISEKGTHQELINLRQEYFSLVKNQLELDSHS